MSSPVDLYLAVEEWRAARQDIFTNTTKISEENVERWRRLPEAECNLMRLANAAAKVIPYPESALS